MGTSLPPKEANLFKLIVKSYETKQYKKGLKAADGILKKFPEHGETLAMKGLTLNCMERKAEAYELVRKGLKNDVKSHVCWHVYGLLYRSDREYREAIKCYRNALRIDPENIQILRDLSLLQVQMRDLAGFAETRRQLLTLKSNHRNNWISFSIAQHLNQNPTMAVQILEAYEGTLEEGFPPENERYEHSEMLLYKVSLLEESGNAEKALEELKNKQNKIADKLGLKESTASLLLQLNRLDEAEKLYRELIDICPDNTRYHEGLNKCLGLSTSGQYSSDEVQRLVQLYDELRERHPDSAVAKRMPLDFLEGDAFREAVKSYIQPFLRKGVPSLFTDLRPLYASGSKASILEDVILELESSLRTSGAFPGSDEKEPPSALMWALYLLAQHYDFKRDLEKALEKIDDAIQHTPTGIDLYLVKGRIMKHAGDAAAAAALADEARKMDLADRYVNSECVKRMLQADQIDNAEKTAALFTRDGDQHNNLYDMQCMWYELASGDSHFRQGILGKALKKYVAVEKHYNDMTEDQFDFHTYCLRKMTLRAYVRMLHFQDRLHSFPFFFRAACCIIRCYIKIHDFPPKTAVEEEEAANAGLSAAERKKLRLKNRKAEARAKKEAEEKAKEEEKAVKSGKKGNQTLKVVDNDPDGEQLVHVENPLGEALKYLKLLQAHSADSLETHLLAFEVYLRLNKILLALQAINRLSGLNSDHPDVHHCTIRFYHMIDNLPPAETPSDKLVREVVSIERSSRKNFGQESLQEVNRQFLDKYSDSLRHRLVAAEAFVLLDPSQSDNAVKVIEDSPATKNGSGLTTWELKDCISVHKKLEGVFANRDAAQRWSTRCAQLFPYSAYFRGPKSSAVRSSSEDDKKSTEPNGVRH